MDEFIKELDAGLDYLGHEIMADEVILYVASNRKSCRCPYCGHTSMRIHSRYEKSFQDLPIMGKKTKVVIENRKFFCDNQDCTFTTFAERFDFLEQNGKKTKRLIDKIIDISLNTSSVAASRALKDGIADVGKSTICNLLKKEIPLPEKHSIAKVCIDDSAFRKRQAYGTIMVDIDTHRVVDLLASRDVEDVAEWLRSYPNIRTVPRDGSVSYKSAIEQAGMDIQQVSGRSHLPKDLTDAAKKFISRLLSANFMLPTEASHYGGKPTGDYWDKPIKEDSPTAEHNANVEKKMKVVKQVRELRKQGFNKGEIAGLAGTNRATAAKYLKEDFNPANPYYNTTIPSKIKPYAEAIKTMLPEGKTFKQIGIIIREKGYAGSDAAIRMLATRERKIMKETARQGLSGEKIKRKWLVSLLYRSIDKISSISAEQLDRIIGEYPAIGRVYDAVSGFKQTLLGKKESELDKWLEETGSLEIDELSSFTNGTRRDIAAVKNAILLDCNNGLAEGSVNKLKAAKRIMYGRNSFGMLKGKLLRLELKRKIN